MTCHNRKNKTLACLDSLYKQSLSDGLCFEVFLVDDGCTDGSADAVRKMFPDVNLIQGNGKLFWNKGMHLAWTKAFEFKKHSYYLWLNDDVQLKDNALSELLNCSEQLYDKSVICGSMQSAVTYETTYGGYLLNRNQLLIPNGALQKCDYFNGNLVLIPKYVFISVGMLDPIYPHAIGDFDYALRAKELGIDCFVTPRHIGFCERNDKLPKWCRPEEKFIERIKNLYSPLGRCHPYYYWIYEKRHFGILKGVKHFITIHLRLFFPKLWYKC